MTQKELDKIIEIVEDMFEEMIEEFSDDAIVVTDLMMESIKIAKEDISELLLKAFGGVKMSRYSEIQEFNEMQGCFVTEHRGNNINIIYLYERGRQDLFIVLSKPLPEESDYLDLISDISDIDGVGTCAIEHRYRLVCNVNLWHFDSEKIRETISKILDDFFMSKGKD